MYAAAYNGVGHSSDGENQMKKLLETLTALAPFLAPYPSWAKALVVVWAILTAIVLVTLVLARPTEDTQKPSMANGPRERNAHKGMSVTFGEGNVSIESIGGDKVGRDKIAGNKIEKQVLMSGKAYDQSVAIESFSIDVEKCSYEQHDFDSNKPPWPKDENAITVCYRGDGKIEMYGKVFNSRKDADDYGDRISKIRNHYSFSEQSVHKMYLERLDDPKQGNKGNCPVFYVSVAIVQLSIGSIGVGPS